MMIRTAALALLMLANRHPTVPAQATACAPVAGVIDNYSMVYGTDPKAESLDMYYPDAARGEPLVIFVHGGAWSYGDKKQYARLGTAFAECGVAFAIVNYRHAPAARPDAQAVEIAKAVKWLADRAGSDAFALKRIYLMGHSAGAEIIALVLAGRYPARATAGLAPGTVAGAIAMDGTGYDPFMQTHGIVMHPLRLFAFAGAFGIDPSLWASYDVHQYLNGSEPSMLVVHADRDIVAPEFESADFVKELKAAGDTVTYLQVPHRDHFSVLKDMTSGAGDPTFEAILQFVTR
jgi:arylformamidase